MRNRLGNVVDRLRGNINRTATRIEQTTGNGIVRRVAGAVRRASSVSRGTTRLSP